MLMMQRDRLTLLLLLLSGTLYDISAGQSLTLFWYTDTSDLVPGKTPDLTIKPGSPPYGTTDPPSGPGEKTDAVDVTDVIRGSVFPTATDMNKVKWHPSLEDAATTASKKCDGSTDIDQISFASATKLTYKEALILIVSNGKKGYDSATKKCKKTDQASCEQYRRLLASGNTGIACSRATCPETALPYRVHCVLAPKLSHAAAALPIYVPGTPCQLCPSERGYCYYNLCVSHADKVEIVKREPGAVITCSAPCMNCGERKDVANVCSCHCPVGYTTKPDCSGGANPSVLTCGICARAGRHCQNGGIDSGEATCRCLCPRAFKGPSCEIPDHGYTGGVIVPIEGPQVCAGTVCGVLPPDLRKLDIIVDEVKTTMANDINTFCKKNQANYIKCCGFGTLPTTGAVDFVSAADIQVVKPVTFDADGKLNAPMYATVRGNNGLCRKTTDAPPPIVPIPPEVLTEVINDKVPNLKAPCCQVSVTTVTNTVKVVIGTGQPQDISCLIVSV